MGRASGLNMVKYGSREGVRVVPGIVPLQPPQSSTTPGTPLPPHIAGPGMQQCRTVMYPGLNSAVGLISVQQLTLGTHFSDLRDMTEVYNLVRIGDR